MEKNRKRSKCLHRPSLLPVFPLFIAVVCCCLKLASSFNLENRLPIVKYGSSKSYFGYSVAAHIENISPTDTRKWLLVGAPVGTNLQPETNRSGAVFKCPLTPDTNDCEQLIVDGFRQAGQPPIKPYPDENKDGQWLGVTVRSQGTPGGKAMVCAHRYVRVEGQEASWGRGLCYLLNNQLYVAENYDACSGRSTRLAHEEYGYCQVGTSGDMLSDGTMIMGSPGPYTWRGTIFVTATAGSYLQRDKTVYYGSHWPETSPVDKYSYLGMSVTGGKYFSDQYAFAAGAPRSEGFGQVVLFEKSTSNPIKAIKIINGTQFGSNFGYELATADVNGDGLPDLIVAAPFFFEKNRGGAVYVYQNYNHTLPDKATMNLTGLYESRFGLALANLGDLNKDGYEDLAIGAPFEGKGVVYIYLGSKNGLSKEPAQVITVASLRNVPSTLQTFGSSLSGGIDLDENKYPDLLIGAYSSDLVVSLLSRPIINIKTEIKDLELKNIVADKSGCSADPSTNLTCFSFNACCSILPYDNRAKQLDLLYVIEAETYNGLKRFSRVYFAPNKDNIIRKSIRVKVDGSSNCHQETVYIKENTKDIQSPIKFRLNYTIVEPNLPANALPPNNLHPILDKMQADRTFEATFAKDCGDNGVCEAQLELKAEFSSLEKEDDGVYALILGKHNEIHLKTVVRNEEDSAYEAHLFVVHDPKVSFIATSKGSVICNSFNETVVDCLLGNPMKRDASVISQMRFEIAHHLDDLQKLSFTVFANSTSKQLRPHDDIILDTKIVKKAEVSINGKAEPEQVFYGGEIKGESAMEYLEDVGTGITHIFQIFNEGPWKATYMEVDILWPHQVANDKESGKWLLYLEDFPMIENSGGGTCTLENASWVNPLKLERRRYTELIPESLVHPDKDLLIESKSSYVKEENSTASTILNRVRRDRAKVIKAEKLVDEDGRRFDIVTMDCSKKTAKCIKFKCTIFNLEAKREAFIRVKARLFNSTLVSDYPRLDYVKIISRAKIFIPEAYKIQQNTRDDDALSITLAYPELLDQQLEESAPIWIYIVAIVTGILLLLLLILCLYKCGFFKRRRPDATISGNLVKDSETKPFL